MSVPKCTSWLGHKFEARHSSTPILRDADRELDVHGEVAMATIKALYTTITYERDVCIRCGATVEFPTPFPKAEERQ